MGDILQELQLDIPEDMATLQLPNPTLLGYYQDISNNRTMWVEGEIDETLMEVSKYIIRCNIEDKDIPVESRKPIKIFIHSQGGNLDETLALIGLIGISKTPVYTINAGWAYSAAGLILMAGHKKFAMPYTSCLIHSGSGMIGGSYQQAEAQMANYKKLVNEMREFILGHSSIDPKFFKKKVDTEWYLDVDEMLKYGIVDEIVTDIYSVI